MQKIVRASFISIFLMLSYNTNVNADWFGGSDCPPWAYDCNDWPEWTPMYWMEEMSDEFDDNNWGGNNWGGNNWGGNNFGPFGGNNGPYGRPPMMPYGGQAPYGAPAPYGRPPMPMGGPAPYGRPPMPMGGPAPYGMPPMPMGGPAPFAPPAPAPAPVR
ncbi:MAG: hypothetical protein HOM14_00030 [Gammaproteobacteria bacterium]|jgi:hypothetical protein|nr:hypothetical protein [Gammaproteobacteria bacterium]MBT3723863.1 hypothetical protein [Gammaproteobacteria bacterium]MBT4076005.1 hypothetical protein [Gammaproteobacteria bacterium]MBT4193960.1 hypothetical protein [Gammaproteobacteria bacterium]MBT6455572.1 hypothetical protein [Gammaproteobacteria bacterium]